MDNRIFSLHLLLLFFFLVSSLVPALDALLLPNSNATRRRAPVHHELSLDFYSHTCPQLDQIISSVIVTQYRDYPAAGPATIRLFFHDCFVEVCKLFSFSNVMRALFLLYNKLAFCK
jgi:peroxidase